MTIISEVIWYYTVNETIVYHTGKMSQAINQDDNNIM